MKTLLERAARLRERLKKAVNDVHSVKAVWHSASKSRISVEENSLYSEAFYDAKRREMRIIRAVDWLDRLNDDSQ